MGWQPWLRLRTRLALLGWNELEVQQEEGKSGQPSSPNCISMTLNDDIKFRLVDFLAGTATPVKCLERGQA